MSFSSLERSWGRAWNGHPVSIPCHIPCLRYINCGFWNIQSQLCWSSYLVRFKVMSILMGILSRIKPTIFDKWNNSPGCSLLFNLWQGSRGPVSWERCVLKTTPEKAKILCAVAIQIEKEGGRGSKIDGEGPSDYPNVSAPLASQAAFS